MPWNLTKQVVFLSEATDVTTVLGESMVEDAKAI